MNQKPARKMRREEIAQWIMVGCGIVGVLIGASFTAVDRLDLNVSLRAVTILAAILLVACGFVSWIYWRLIDEAAREAHKFAWFWGGQGGMIVTLVLGLFADSTKLTAAYGDLKAAGWMFIGMTALLIGQIVGYGLAWAGWWLVRRH